MRMVIYTWLIVYYEDTWTNPEIIIEFNTVATPTISPSTDSYTDVVSASITCDTEDATIHYTIDGSDPTENDPVFQSGSAITISNTTTLKARAFKDGFISSTIVTATYTITIPQIGPMISHQSLESVEIYQPITIESDIYDIIGIYAATLYYRKGGESTFSITALSSIV